MRDRVAGLLGEFAKGVISVENGKRKLLQTRHDVATGWQAMSDMLINEGRHELAHTVVMKRDKDRTTTERIASSNANPRSPPL